ncbi:Protein-lysine N-methyltransferase rrg1 [Gnomoniopsis smithogilvyi]|uniref:Protein-lysine N-methyltransferase rrg1 n=1 Tax=Gnomoniopsis smithogilvyi TaxID=1191159 RepID=A0A9W9D1L2_9PEZI|nr:Protein-lysine N-methyltransferase rrg1 [Gnomoniopsis smithogilvyi]
MHASDLPQVWQKPSAGVLVEALQQLRVEPPVWNLKTSRAEILKEQETTSQHSREIAAYLSRIIGSELAWISEEEEREAVWSEASKRFSERCGRSAMGEITRRWPFDGEGYPAFDLVVREPPLTGDNLGLKTWGSSYVLAQMLYNIGESALSHLLCRKDNQPVPQVLELGSGTGLLGLAAAPIWKAHVILSDLPEIMPNLNHNVEVNRPTIQARGGSVEAGALTWGGQEDEIDNELFPDQNKFRIIIVADPLYNDDHPRLLAGAIDEQLALDEDARAMVMVPKRDTTTIKLLEMFRDEMASKTDAFVCLEESVVAGQDDWGADEDEEAGNVECWLGIFGRRSRNS